jgi:hypothetical protein
VDWASVIANSPYVQQAIALGNEQLAALRSSLGAAAARALINLGDYSLAGQVKGLSIPKNTQALVDQANAAGTSVLAQLQHQHQANQQAIPAALAGRGFYRSGQTGYQLGEETRAFGNQEYTARQRALDYLNQLYQQYLSQQFAIQQSELNAYWQAYQAALQLAAAAQPQQPQQPEQPQPSLPADYVSIPDLKRQLGYGTSIPWTAGL